MINILCTAGNFGKMWSACGQYKFQYSHYVSTRLPKIIRLILIQYFSIYHMQ